MPTREPAEALVLFDIDGTLIRRAGPHHRQVLVDAVRRVTGLETSLDHIPLHGMLDPDILSRMMLDGGAASPQIRQAMPEIIRVAQSFYVRRCPDLRGKTCPGVRTLLGRLDRRGIPMALVTGNLTRIGWKKMECAGLRHHFRFGAFGEMARDRSTLARMAIAQARRDGWITAAARITLIGDSENDIIAAKASGVQSIAVVTGISTRDELLAHQPDLLLDDLRALRLHMLL